MQVPLSSAQLTPAAAAIEELIETLLRFRSFSADVAVLGGLLVSALKGGHKILTCGNGGSAADALHLAEELTGRYNRDRRSLPAICLAADSTLLTCIANDFGFEKIFSRQVEGLGLPSDILVLFSTSGNSPNLLAAIGAAKRQGMIVIALLGKGGGKMASIADHEIIVPSDVTARIQEIQTLILHAWLEDIDAAFA